MLVGVLQFLLLVPFSLCCTSYQWSNVHIGGGGYVLGIIPHPTEPNLVYARTDVGGAYKFNFSGENWVSLSDSFPNANQFSVESMAVDPTNSKLVYAAFGNGKFTTSGIYKSVDQGETWQALGLQNIFIYGNGDYRWAGERLHVDPFDPSVIWFGSREDGLYLSSNSGENWEIISSIPKGTAPQGVTFVVSGLKSSILYVGVYGVGVFNLTGTNAFSKMINSPEYPVRASVAIDGTLFVTSDIGVHRYRPGEWQTFQPAGNTTYCGITTDPKDESFVIVSVIAQSFNNPYFISTNAGESWKEYNRNTVQVHHDVPWWPTNFFAASTSSIVIDLHNSSHAYMTDWFGTYFSENVKDTTPLWATHELGHEEVVVLALSSHPTIPLLSGTADVSGFVHNNIFAFPNHSVQPLQDTVSIDFSEKDPLFIAKSGTTSHTPVAGTPGGCISVDGGNTWSNFGKQIGYGGRVAVSATSQRILYIPVGQVPHYTDDSGTTWQASSGVSDSVVPTSIWKPATPLASDRVNGSVYYVLDGDEFKVSTNGGLSFSSFFSLTTSGNAQVVARPGSAGEVWICGGLLYRSVDYGKNFAKIQTVETCDDMLSFGKARNSSETSVIYIKGTVGGTDGFYRSENFGENWERIDIPSNPLAKASIVVGDRTTFGRVFVGSSGRGVYYGEDSCA